MKSRSSEPIYVFGVKSITLREINSDPETPRVTKDIVWSTPNGFCYASNEGAMISVHGALDQNVQLNRNVEGLDDGIIEKCSVAILEGYRGSEKTQAWNGTNYVLRVGQSRIYTAEWQGHAAVRTRIVEVWV
ncbi:hypothetical protein HK100_010098 [Physocladia obscura]|uniref:Uncharacterized protein n=1 Tax=Physocladia obscura TaxID=109957 RepID=A0AAD5T3H5_9FUNG|nr:hypothetical protein HK100_010098 [Physocladia obscura]